ncbi:hypothetical protein [Clostridium oryzae]|uniref:Rubrerythrin n=1 Tax=Clostridium oryzae TaxID=1450648 RepID=A0A1V4IUT0_9CLOT|nr:hypothetical protein [Clostridium oryzae]OPJ63545.1 hypothetical protein CLORY_10530 [Clostridium oryzae]
MYTIFDLLEKFVKIQEFGYEFYIKLSDNEDMDNRLRILAKAFSKQEKRYILIYNQIKEESKKYNDVSVDFFVYDKSSQLIYQFFKMHGNQIPASLNEMMKIALNFEKDNLALILRVKGFFVQKEQDVNTDNYKILNNVIEEEKKHIKDLESYCKKYKL